MATMQDIVNGAYRRCDGLLGLGQVPTAEEATEALAALNGMMHGWKSKGVDIEHVTLALGAAFPLADEFEDGVTAMLAVRLSSQNGKAELSPQVTASAASCWSALYAAYVAAPESQFDPSLSRMPSQRLIWF